MQVLVKGYAKLFFLFIYFVLHGDTYTDDEFCHPHCLITCLPSCQCCDSNDPRKADIAESSKRNQLKLERLEQVLRDKDLEVGIICRPSCKERCLPSCKFECCRDGRSNRKRVSGLNTEKDLKIKAGFDLRKLLKSMEETQREYKRLKEFIKQVNTSSTGNNVHSGAFHIVTAPKVRHVRRKYVKHHTDKDQSLKLLKTLSKLQDVLDERESIKKKARQRILDSPYAKLLTSKPKLKVEIIDELEKWANIHDKKPTSLHVNKATSVHDNKVTSVHDNKATSLKKSQSTKQTKANVRKSKHIFKEDTDKSNCDKNCKEFCSPSCQFECCVTNNSRPINSTENKNFKNESSEIRNSTNNSPIDVNVLPSNQSVPIAVDTETFPHVKKQIDGLIGELERISSFHGQNKSVNNGVCNPACKTDCVPECAFQCCV